VLLSIQIAMKRRGAGGGDVRLGCWQIAGSSAMRALVLIRLMLDVLISVDGFQSSG
jgi:hypothetical protein